MKVLIVEDEDAAARGLIAALEAQRLYDIEVLMVIDSVDCSIKYLKNNPAPDLIFMDIQLSDGLSFKIFEKVEVSSPIIFCTAYDQYAIQAFKVNGLDYLLKPVDEEDVLKSLKKLKSWQERVLNQFNLSELGSVFENLKAKPAYKNRFLVKAGQKFSYKNTEDVACFYTSEGIHYLRTFNGRKFQIDKTIEEVERLVDPEIFFRINRQCLINIRAVKSVEQEYRRLLVHTEPVMEEEQFVSRQRTQAFKNWLDD